MRFHSVLKSKEEEEEEELAENMLESGYYQQINLAVPVQEPNSRF